MRFAFAPTIAFFCAACGIDVAYVALNTPPHQMTPRPKDQVEVFSSKQPDRPYVEVGTIEVQQEHYNHAGAQELTNKMREVAGQRGCEGIILAGANDGVTVSGYSGPNGGQVSGRTLKGYRATCIVYKDAEASAPAAAAPAAPAPPGDVTKL